MKTETETYEVSSNGVVLTECLSKEGAVKFLKTYMECYGKLDQIFYIHHIVKIETKHQIQMAVM
jgi:hypothetical protein